MSQNDYPTAPTVDNALQRERRCVNWARETIAYAHEHLLTAANDLPDTAEYAEARRAMYRAIDRLRQARGALGTAGESVTEALVLVEKAAPVYITNAGLKARYQGKGANGAEMVERARRERERRHQQFDTRQAERRERERRRFLGEGMRDGDD